LKRFYDQKKIESKEYIKKNRIFETNREKKISFHDSPKHYGSNQIQNYIKKRYLKNLNQLSNIISKKKPTNKKDLHAIEQECEMQIDDINNSNPFRSKMLGEKSNSKGRNFILDDNFSDNYNSNDFLNIANNRKLPKKSIGNSKQIKATNQNCFFNTENNSIDLMYVKDYISKMSTQQNQNQKSEKDNLTYKYDPKEKKLNNFLNIEKFKNNTINFGFSDNSSVTSSEKSCNNLVYYNSRSSTQNIKNNLVKKNIMIKNHHIQDFFPVTNLNKEKEEELLRTLLNLLTNDKYSKLISLLENNREILSSISSTIHKYSDKVISEFNIINEEIVYLEKNKINDSSFDEYVFFLDPNTKLDFKSNNEESFKILFGFYKDNLIDFINLFYSDNEDEDYKNRDLIKLNEENKMKQCIDKLMMAENLIKMYIKQSDQIFSMNDQYNFDIYSFINIPLKNIKELFLFFLKKVLLDHDFYKENAYNVKYSSLEFSDINIFSDFLINRLGVFIIMVENFVNIENNILKLINNNNFQAIKRSKQLYLSFQSISCDINLFCFY
jgi:hypothetical protein